MENRTHIGIDIGGTHMRSGLVDESGRILARRRLRTEIRLGPEQAAERLLSECLALVRDAEAMSLPVRAIGLGVAGKIDPVRGLVLFSPNLPAMNGYPLATVLSERTGLPVFMENDANVFGLGEGWAGAAKGIENWIGVTLGTGVGGCLIFGGRLWNGDRLGFVGEIGHMIIQPGGPLCLCGLRGCLEAHASGGALVRGARDAVDRGEAVSGPLFDWVRAGTLDPEAVYRCARAGDPAALALFERLGWALGLALANLFTVLGIRTAVIGGGVSAGWDLFSDALRRSLNDNACMFRAEEMSVRRSLLGDDAALIGAARLARISLESNLP